MKNARKRIKDLTSTITLRNYDYTALYGRFTQLNKDHEALKRRFAERHHVQVDGMMKSMAELAHSMSDLVRSGKDHF